MDNKSKKDQNLGSLDIFEEYEHYEEYDAAAEPQIYLEDHSDETETNPHSVKKGAYIVGFLVLGLLFLI